jgi:hypothetical protein
MMHMKQGLYFSTDIPKEQTTLNPTFPKGRLLGAKEWCGVVRVEVWVAKIRAKGKVL